MRAYVGLGANLGQPARQVQAALEALRGIGSVVAVSPFYCSQPIGPGEQPDYCNAVCVLDTELPPEPLMQALLAIERTAGRVRDGLKWQARPLDLDLLHIPGVNLQTPLLQLPHPGIAARNFVLVPLADIAPDLEIPGIGCVAAAAAILGHRGLRAWRD